MARGIWANIDLINPTLSRHCYDDEKPPERTEPAPQLEIWKPAYVDADGVPVLTFE